MNETEWLDRVKKNFDEYIHRDDYGIKTIWGDVSASSGSYYVTDGSQSGLASGWTTGVITQSQPSYQTENEYNVPQSPPVISGCNCESCRQSQASQPVQAYQEYGPIQQSSPAFITGIAPNGEHVNNDFGSNYVRSINGEPAWVQMSDGRVISVTSEYWVRVV